MPGDYARNWPTTSVVLSAFVYGDIMFRARHDLLRTRVVCRGLPVGPYRRIASLCATLCRLRVHWHRNKFCVKEHGLGRVFA